MLFESQKQKLPPCSSFLKRFIRYALFALLLVLVTLGVGVPGYSYIADLHRPENFHMAAMNLPGLESPSGLKTGGTKLFSSLQVLCSGLALLSLSAACLSPVLHRCLHKLQVGEE